MAVLRIVYSLCNLVVIAMTEDRKDEIAHDSEQDAQPEETIDSILDEFRWQIKGILKSGTAEPTEYQLKFQREALARLNSLLNQAFEEGVAMGTKGAQMYWEAQIEGIIGEDEPYDRNKDDEYNIVFIPVRNGLRAEQRTRFKDHQKHQVEVNGLVTKNSSQDNTYSYPPEQRKRLKQLGGSE